MEFTVLTFAKLQFIGKWTRVVSPTQLLTIYTPLGAASGEVLVVAQSPTGTEVTYYFIITAKEQVLVSTQQNIIQLPAICIKNAKGDAAGCRG